MNLPLHGSPLTILMYHSVNPEPDDYSVTPARFRQHMALVSRHYPVVALKDIRSALANTTVRKVIITFDDAFVDFLEHAYQILAEFNLPVTLFVPTGFVGRSNLWDSQLLNVTPKPIMDVHALRRVCADGLVDLGSHTVDHVRMRRLTQNQMHLQAATSKRWLEDTFGKPVTMFSYPYGQRDDFSDLTEKVLSDTGYQAAVTTCWGTRNSRRNLFALRRVHFSNREDLETVRAKIEGWYDWIGLKECVGFILRAGMRMIRTRG